MSTLSMALHGCRKSVVVKSEKQHLIESEVDDDENFTAHSNGES